MINFKMTVRADCAVSACSLLPLSIKALAHWLSPRSWKGLAFGHEFTLPAPTPVASIQNKANFPFHQPCLFISFWVASSQTPAFSNITCGSGLRGVEAAEAQRWSRVSLCPFPQETKPTLPAWSQEPGWDSWAAVGFILTCFSPTQDLGAWFLKHFWRLSRSTLQDTTRAKFQELRETHLLSCFMVKHQCFPTEVRKTY